MSSSDASSSARRNVPPLPALVLFDSDPWRGTGTVFFERRLYLRCDGAIDQGMFATGIDSRDRTPRIGVFADAGIERHFAEKRHAEFCRLVTGASPRLGSRFAVGQETVYQIAF